MAIPQTPNGFLAAHTIHDTNSIPKGTVGIWFRVTAAGTIKFEDRDGVTISPEFDTGTYARKFSNLKRVWSTGTGATLGPVNTVFMLAVKATATED